MLPEVVDLRNNSIFLKNEHDIRLKVIAARCSEMEMKKQVYTAA